jgi:hypothetical protein
MALLVIKEALPNSADRWTNRHNARLPDCWPDVPSVTLGVRRKARTAAALTRRQARAAPVLLYTACMPLSDSA